MSNSRYATVAVAPGINVLDASKGGVIDAIVDARAASASRSRGAVVTAVHVGGLVSRRTPGYLDGLSAADIVYADGIAVVLIAKAAGARHIERAALTDIGVPVIEAISAQLGRPARVALVGGADGLADRAGRALEKRVGCEVVLAAHGYRSEKEWSALWRELTERAPDVTYLGLGEPHETLRSKSINRSDLPGVLLTCGGWFGFLTEDELRAPRWAQRVGLEWVYRLRQSPRRLMPRYVLGGVATAQLIATALIGRVKALASVG